MKINMNGINNPKLGGYLAASLGVGASISSAHAVIVVVDLSGSRRLADRLLTQRYLLGTRPPTFDGLVAAHSPAISTIVSPAAPSIRTPMGSVVMLTAAARIKEGLSAFRWIPTLTPLGRQVAPQVVGSSPALITGWPLKTRTTDMGGSTLP